MDNRGRFHRKIIACARVIAIQREEGRVDRAHYGEKDTMRQRLLLCITHYCQNVMYFGGNLGSAIGN